VNKIHRKRKHWLAKIFTERSFFDTEQLSITLHASIFLLGVKRKKKKSNCDHSKNFMMKNKIFCLPEDFRKKGNMCLMKNFRTKGNTSK
jgi:hypothetical protein